MTSSTGAPVRPAAAPSAAVARPASQAPRPVTQVTVTAPPGSPLALVQQYWPSMLEAVKNSSRSVEAFLKESRPVEADADSVVLGFRYSFHKDSVDNPKNRALVEESFGKVLAHPVRIQCTLLAKEGQAASATVAPTSQSKTSAASEDAVVRFAENKFQATVLSVEKTEQ